MVLIWKVVKSGPVCAGNPILLSLLLISPPKQHLIILNFRSVYATNLYPLWF